MKLRKAFKTYFPLIAILLFSAFMRFYKIQELVPFIGDQAWFYLSARDMMQTGQIPLVGITSSHTWLHQGALWTYILGPILYLADYHPAAPSIFTAGIGVVTTGLLYWVSEKLYNSRVAIIAALFYAVAPISLIYDRMAYHIGFMAPLSLLSYYFLYAWIQGETKYVPWLMLSLVLLFNFELVGILLIIAVLVVIAIGLIGKQEWVRKAWNKDVLIPTFFAVLIPMIPYILYDLQNGFPHTVKFAGWTVVRVGEVAVTVNKSNSLIDVLKYFKDTFGRLLIYNAGWVALFLFILSYVHTYIQAILSWRSNKFENPIVLLFILSTVVLIGIVGNGTLVAGYLLLIFPQIMMIVGIFLDSGTKYLSFVHILILTLFITSITAVGFYRDNFLVDVPNGYGPSLKTYSRVARQILEDMDGETYAIIAKGKGSHAESAKLNTSYLVWWYGDREDPVATDEADDVFEVIRLDGTLSLRKL